MLLKEARGQAWAQDNNYKFGVAPVPHFGLRPAISRIAGQDTSKYQHNNGSENAHRKAMHFECSVEDVRHLQSLVDTT